MYVFFDVLGSKASLTELPAELFVAALNFSELCGIGGSYKGVRWLQLLASGGKELRFIYKAQ